jgi:hypothetical protein
MRGDSRRQAARIRPDHQDVDVPLHQALMTTHSAAKTARTRADKIRELPSFLCNDGLSVPAVFSRMPTWRASIASTVADSAMHATAASRLGHLALNSLLRRNVRFHCVSDQIADIALRQPRTNSELDAPRVRPIEKQHHRRGCSNNPRPRQRQFVDAKVVSGSPAMPHVPM